jgi:hypothetical protein
MSIKQVWWFMPAIPAIQEVEVGGSQSQDSLGKNTRSYAKNKTRSKRAGRLAHLPSK